MTDILAWVSLALQLWTMGWPFWDQHCVTQTEQGESEINLGFYRRRVSWTQRRVARR
jgi:hypothetical protein